MRPIGPLPALCLLASLATGCLGDPQSKTCAELPPGTAGCEADARPLDAGPDVGPMPADEGPVPDGQPQDAGPDARSDVWPPDAGPDMWPSDGAAPDATAPDATGPDATGPDAAGPDAIAPDAAPPGECEPGTSRPCGTDVGACQVGQQFCNAEGVYDACLGAVDPADEVCDGVDNDCDDETDEGCDCIDGATQDCGSDVGACRFGTQTCADGAWGPCEGGLDGTEERCNDIDDDCNGTVDDLPALADGQLCTVGLGECRVSAPLTCAGSNDGELVCPAEAPAGIPESCNLRDDDCDGRTDEDTPLSVSRLFTGNRVDHWRTAVSSYGEFHGVAYIDDGRVFFGLALGDEWEIEPAEVGFFNGDDTIATHIAMTSIFREGFRLIVAYDGLGSGVTVLNLSGGGAEVGERFDADVPFSNNVDVAWDLERGVTAVYEDADVGAGTRDIGLETYGVGARPVRRTIVGGQNALRDPSVVLTSGAVADTTAVAYVRTDLRSNAGNLELARFVRGALQPVVCTVSESGTARDPDLHFLAGRQLYAVSWDEVERGVRRVKVAVLDAACREVARVSLPTAADAQRSSLVPIAGREGVDRLAVVWDRSNDVGFQIELGWVVDADRGWAASPTVQRIFGEQGTTGGATGAYAGDGEGIGVMFSYEAQGRSAVFATLPNVCPELP